MCSSKFQGDREKCLILKIPDTNYEVFSQMEQLDKLN